MRHESINVFNEVKRPAVRVESATADLRRIGEAHAAGCDRSKLRRCKESPSKELVTWSRSQSVRFEGGERCQRNVPNARIGPGLRGRGVRRCIMLRRSLTSSRFDNCLSPGAMWMRLTMTAGLHSTL